MEKKDIRLIAIDIDGTLVDNQKVLHRQTIEAIEKVKKQGVLVTLATGRTWGSAMAYARQLDIDQPLITNSGAFIASPSRQEFAKTTLNMDMAREMVRLLEQEQYYVKIYADDHLYVQEATDETVEFSRKFQVPYTVVGQGQLSKMTIDPLSIVILDNPERVQQAFRLLTPWQPSFCFNRDFNFGIEILHRSVSKGVALRWLCSHLKISMEQVMAFGDQENDFDMITSVGMGVAMGNAFPELKQRAKVVTKTNEEFGVAHLLNEYFS